jgi:hypothetical protein
VIKGDVYIFKQGEIDRFATDHPGCTAISGNLTIEEEYEGTILNLEGLSQLEKIGGYIRIWDNHALSSLNGLENIDTIGNSLWIEGNLALTDITGITSIKSIMYGLNIGYQPNLHQIDTFLFLDTIGTLIISGIPNLKDLSCFSHVRHITRSCIIEKNAGLESLNGLYQLKSIGESLELKGNDKLINLKGLENLSHSGGLTIRNQPMVRDLEGLDSLKWIHSLRLEQNEQLASIQQLEHLISDSLKYIHITSNPLLSQCQILPICDAFPHTEEYPEIEDNGAGCTTPLELIHGCGFNGSCPQDVVLYTQSDVDRFAEVYPGCDSIYGDLSIQSNTITNLQGLAQVSYIGGRLYIYNNDQLTTLDGLEQVRSIDGAIEIIDNDRLHSITGLSGLQKVQNGFRLTSNDSIAALPEQEMFHNIHGDLVLGNNASLQNINALGNLRSIGGDLRIYSNPVLLSLTGLENLESVAGQLSIENLKIEDLSAFANLDTITNRLYISSCPLLHDLNGIENLRFLKSLHISNCDAIQSLIGLNAITTLTGNIEISNNAALVSISGLAALQQVDGMIIIKNNPLLQQMNAFRPLTSVGGITLENNPQLTSLEYFQNLQLMTGGIIIKSMPGLTSFTGLHQLQSIQGSLDVSANDFLLSLNGMDQLNVIGGKLQLKDNNLLNSLNALDALDSIGGDFLLENCGLTELNGFISLRSIGGVLNVSRNPGLKSISGFDQMTKAGGLYIISNPVLSSFYGFSGLSVLTGIMEIKKNFVLAQLPAWDKLTETDTSIRIEDNNKLKSIAFLNHLQSVGSLELYRNPIDTLFCKRLKQVQGELSIEYCGGLDVIFLDSLSHIGGDLTISTNGELDSLGSIQSLVETGGSIRIRDNLSLLNIEALSSLQRFNGRLDITGNKKLTSIEGLRNVERSSFYVPGNQVNQNVFTITNNGNLSACAIPAICEILEDPSASYDLNSNTTRCNNSIEIQAQCGLPDACIADSIVFDSQAGIDAFPDDYPGCTFVRGKIIIEESQLGGVLNLDSLISISRIGGDLVIRNNAQLIDLNGLDHLTDLGGSLWIQNNSSLNSLMSLKELAPHKDLIGSAGHKEFVITDNPNLSACSIPFICSTMTDPYKVYDLSDNNTGCGTVAEVQLYCDYPTECKLGYVSTKQELEQFPVRYPRCTHITDYIDIFIDYEISDLSPLALIESVDGPVYLEHMQILTTLDGLDHLVSINGPLVIRDNDQLEDISALRQLDPSSLRKRTNHFELADNPKLSACAIQSVCQIAENPEIATDISDNGYRCETRERILKNCTVGVLTPDEQLDIIIYPNPATDQIHISSSTDLHDNIISVAIVDINGSVRTVSPFTSSVDVSHLPSGLYVILLQSHQHGLLTYRFIVAR